MCRAVCSTSRTTHGVSLAEIFMCKSAKDVAIKEYCLCVIVFPSPYYARRAAHKNADAILAAPSLVCFSLIALQNVLYFLPLFVKLPLKSLHIVSSLKLFPLRLVGWQYRRRTILGDFFLGIIYHLAFGFKDCHARIGT